MLQALPVSLHPEAARQVVTPEPGSVQIRVQQFEAFEQGSPSCLQPPEATVQRPTPPSPLAGHSRLQHSELRVHTSPTDWQLEARTQAPPLQFVEQHSDPALHAWPITRQEPPTVG